MSTEKTSDTPTTLLAAAARVWANAEVRALIIDQMSLGEVHKALSLSRDVFPDMARVLYRRFDYVNYHRVIKAAVSYMRVKVYIESIRTLSLEGNVNRNKTINGSLGFTELLDMFPLVNEIIVNDGKHRLTTPPRLLDVRTTSRPTATFHISISTRKPKEHSSPFESVFVTLRDYESSVVYAVHVSEDCPIDWDLSKWDRLGTSRSTPSMPWDKQSLHRDVPFCAVSSRNIYSMTIDHNVDLDVLSRHLKQRQRIGWKAIKEWDLSVVSISALPTFLVQNGQIESIKLKKSETLPISIGGFLCLDWSVLRRIEENHNLQHLEFTIDFSQSCGADIEARLDDIISAYEASAPVFKLHTFTIRLTDDIHGEPEISALPPFSKIAKLLVQLIGYECQCVVDFEDEDDSGYDFTDLAFRNCLRSQLIKEVKARQKEERRRNLEREDEAWIEVDSSPGRLKGGDDQRLESGSSSSFVTCAETETEQAMFVE